jgi:hypothetical protein
MGGGGGLPDLGGILGGLMGGGGGLGGMLGGLMGGGMPGGMLAQFARLAMSGGALEHRMQGSANIDVNVNAPHGTNVRASANGLFKKTRLTRQTQMPLLEAGAPTPASIV